MMNDFEEGAEIDMGKLLLATMIDQVKAMPDVWQKMGTDARNDVHERFKRAINAAVNRAISQIVSAGCQKLVVKLDKIDIKDEIKAHLVVYGDNENEPKHTLFSSVGKNAMLLLTGADEFVGGMNEMNDNPKQMRLPL